MIVKFTPNSRTLKVYKSVLHYTQKNKGAFEGAEGVIGAFSSFFHQQSYPT